jgi:hypothetical protein
VQDPAEARPFLPQLQPLLDRLANEAADPELREVRLMAVIMSCILVISFVCSVTTWFFCCCGNIEAVVVVVAVLVPLGSLSAAFSQLLGWPVAEPAPKKRVHILSAPPPPLPRHCRHNPSLCSPQTPLPLTQVGARARDALQRVSDAADKQEAEVGRAADAEQVAAALRSAAAEAAPGADLRGGFAAAVLGHVAAVGESLVLAKAHSQRWVGGRVGGWGWCWCRRCCEVVLGSWSGAWLAHGVSLSVQARLGRVR